MDKDSWQELSHSISNDQFHDLIKRWNGKHNYMQNVQHSSIPTRLPYRGHEIGMEVAEDFLGMIEKTIDNN